MDFILRQSIALGGALTWEPFRQFMRFAFTIELTVSGSRNAGSCLLSRYQKTCTRGRRRGAIESCLEARTAILSAGNQPNLLLLDIFGYDFLEQAIYTTTRLKYSANNTFKQTQPSPAPRAAILFLVTGEK